MLRVEILATFFQTLVNWDKQLFQQLNSGWTNPVFDFILPYFRDPVFWAPLYLLMVSFMLLNYGKKGFWWSIAFLCTLAITDMVGHRVFKEGFERLRPCRDPEFFHNVRLLVRTCSGGFSFTSNHAANHFGVATFVSATMYPTFKRWIYLFYLWAFLVSYAQIYVGVHYPGDILGGALLGVLAGLLTATFFNNKSGTIKLAV
ncbi:MULTISPECIES: phosphatase PAP2 family protein [Chitinophagaceae]|uniref:phosphatase PAP2 family protein n=1 Tax=Chitinophagaceae TaxID=563835 RepID=UPI000F51786D|nr:MULTISPECIES: phosphatase PAP2 family protein [Chitinophagaceae]RPD51782.1 phosphatase PAP2 family protein [Paracnuella aquatica]